MSDNTGELVALRAQMEAKLDQSCVTVGIPTVPPDEVDTLQLDREQILGEIRARNAETEPCPPPDEVETARFEQSAKEARIYLHACALKGEVDRYVTYLAGKINGVEVDVAQLQPMHPRMSELERKLDMLLEQQGDILKSVKTIAGDVNIVASTVIDHGEAIEKLRAQHMRNHPLKLSVVPPEDSEAREAE